MRISVSVELRPYLELSAFRCLTMKFRQANLADSHILTELNQQLIRDEGHRNRMTFTELEARMQEWLDGEYEAHFFELLVGRATE